MDKAGKVEEKARALASVLREEGLAEVCLETRGELLRVRRRRSALAAPVPPLTVPEPLRIEEAEIEESLEEQAAVPVTSTRVGVLHLSDPRGGPALAGVGQGVHAGQVLAWIETMGLHHEVHAPEEGSVLELLVQDGEPVEYGQALLILQRGRAG